MYIMMTWTSFHVMMTSRYDQGILCGQLLGEGHSAASSRWTPGVWLSRVRPADGSLPPKPQPKNITLCNSAAVLQRHALLNVLDAVARI
jgi:hypothetical protein